MSSWITGSTGRTIEQDYLKNIKPEKIKDYPNPKLYVPYRKAIEICKAAQPWENPSAPESFFLKDLHEEITRKSKLEDKNKLKIYTAIGSHLDYLHGIDFFVEEVLPNGKVIRVTGDLTENPNKDEYKADLIFLVPYGALDPALPADKKEYGYMIGDFAQKFIKEINDKNISKS